MGIFRKLFGLGNKSKPYEETSLAAVNDPIPELSAVAKKLADAKQDAPAEQPVEEPSVDAPAPEAAADEGAPAGIWDMASDDDVPEEAPAVEEAPAEPVAAPTKASGRMRRNRTRLIGFDKSDGSSADSTIAAVMEEVKPAPTVTFPVGWLLVVSGPGKGHSFPLMNGLSSIGRAVDNIVALDFGDDAISRSGHAAIAWDEKKRSFTIGHGNKANIVRLNDSPVISNETLKDGDMINIGDTVLRLVVLCDDTFDWSNYEDEEGQEDVAIA